MITRVSTITPQQALRRFWLTVSLTLISLMLNIDSTIANVALPHIRSGLSASQDQIAWVLTSYILATAIMVPPSAFLASRFGRKQMLLVCASGFLAASMLCGLATSIEQMVVFRFLQGAFGAPTAPLVQAAILDMYTMEERAKSMAIVTIGIMMGSVFGPTLGGVLTEFYDWRWIFFINLPIGLLALAGIFGLMRETEKKSRIKFDAFGFVMLALGICALQLALDRGESQGWLQSNEIIVEFIIAALCFYTFVVHMFTHREPFLEAALFRDRNFLAALIFLFFSSSSMLVVLALLPIYLQNLLGIPALNAGILMAPRAIATLITSLLIPRLAAKLDLRMLLASGVVLSTVALYQMAHFTLDISIATIVCTGLIQGVGVALTNTPANILLVSTLDRRYFTEASAMNNLVRNIGSSSWIALMVAMFTHNTQVFHAELSQSVTAFRDATQIFSLPQAWNWTTAAGAMALDGEVTRQASGIAIFNDFSIMQWTALMTLPLVFLFSHRAATATLRK